jgi:hypothetical protein
MMPIDPMIVQYLRTLIATIPVTAFNDSRLSLDPAEARVWLEARARWPLCVDKIKPEDIEGPDDFMRTKNYVPKPRKPKVTRKTKKPKIT